MSKHLDRLLASMPADLRARMEPCVRLVLATMDIERVHPDGPVRDSWAVYSCGILRAGDHQVELVRAARVAFYAGAAATFDAMMMGLEEGPEETPGDMQLMEDMTAEFRAACRVILRDG